VGNPTIRRNPLGATERRRKPTGIIGRTLSVPDASDGISIARPVFHSQLLPNTAYNAPLFRRSDPACARVRS
jgi:hypothetical protein